MDEVDLLKIRLAREVAARKQAEKILEEKSLELYELSNRLSLLNERNEQVILERTKEIEANEIKYRNLVENASDIIYKVDETGQFTYVNPKAILVSGYSEEELLGMNFIHLVDEKYQSSIQNFYRFQLSEKNKSSYTEFLMVTKSGERRWIGQTSDLDIQNGERNFNVLGRDITDQKRAEKALLLSEDKYRSIIENMELGLLEVDREGIILKAYPKFCELTGFPEDELKGKEAASFFLDPEEQSKMKERNLNRKNGEASVYETQISRKDGTKIWVLISGAPYYDEKNRVSGSVGIHLDITKQKLLESDLRNSNKRAEESVKHKDLFLTNVSHEIRTPLNAIIGITELLLQRSLEPIEAKYVSIIEKSSNNLLRLINDILDLASIKSGKLDFHETPTRLSNNLNDLYDTFSVLAEKKGITLTLDAEIDHHQWYSIDATRLDEVIVNLLGNALKFTKKGSVTLTVRKQLSYEDADYFSFEIADTGIGIPPEDLERVFDNFEQAANNSKGEHGGTGLGLSISKSIVEHMKGTLNVSSVYGKGTKFFFEVSFKRLAAPAPQLQEPKLTDNFVLSGKQILVAEDMEVNQFVAKTILEQWGCVVSVANNGQEVLDLLKTSTFDIILMDVRMPILDGLETTKRIRDTTADLPILALTANATSGESDHCIEAGMNDYLCKPYTQLQLKTKICSLLNVSVSKENNTHESLVDLSKLSQITNGDRVFEEKMIALFVSESKLRLTDLEKSLENVDFQGIIHIAHSIKPSISHICAPSLFNLVQSIEMTKTFDDLFIQKVKDFIHQLEKVIIELS